VVVLANLSGFDGSPESLRRLQLEYGAEIGRAIVNFDGPIVLCVVSRYHGGAFVVFSGQLNDRMQVLAVEGAHASVIGGAPAAAVVFTRDVNARTQADDRVRELETAIGKAPVHERARLRAELASVRAAVRNEMLGVVAAEFDAVHSVQRAKEVGSVHDIVSAARLRPELIAAVERGLAESSEDPART
jgi:acetyl-CoA carboxylase carboxyltransferase component